MSLELDYVTKYGKPKYPLIVKIDEDLDLKDLGKKYNFSMFTKIPQKFVTIDFKKKRDLFSFITKEDVDFIFKIKK